MIALTIWTCVSKLMSLLFNMLSSFVIAFLPRSVLILWLQSASIVILEPKKRKPIPALTSTSWITTLSWQRCPCNSMMLWAMPCRATLDGWIIVESSVKTWPTGRGNGKQLQYFCHKNSMSSMKSQKDMTMKDESSRLGVQHATGEELRTMTSSSRKNEVAEPKC